MRKGSRVGLSLSPATYKTKVGGICTTGLAKMKALPQPVGPSDIATYFQSQGDIGKSLLTQIGSVKVPTALKTGVGKALKLQGQQVDIVLSVAAQMKKGVDPQKAIDAVNLQMSTLSKQTDAAWTAIGLTACL